MLHDFEEINGILATMGDEGLVEPIDDPNVEVDFWDWADIIGVVDDFVPQLVQVELVNKFQLKFLTTILSIQPYIYQCPRYFVLS